jgi:predicted DNA-binding protein with PD1-like motif
MQTFAFRLHPYEDLCLSLDKFAQDHGLEAACVLACVGSLRQATLRYANQPNRTVLEGKFEIVSLTGTFSRHGSHYHVAVSDGEGRAFGGHLLPGCLIYTTAEIVVGVLPGLLFGRELDPDTGYPELVIRPTS